VQEDLNEGRAIGVASTPTLVINGRVAPGAASAEALAGILEQELAYQRARERARAGS
jgi:predicted DsbA family dithiol-disulfide isomerase